MTVVANVYWCCAQWISKCESDICFQKHGGKSVYTSRKVSFCPIFTSTTEIKIKKSLNFDNAWNTQTAVAVQNTILETSSYILLWFLLAKRYRGLLRNISAYLISATIHVPSSNQLTRTTALNSPGRNFTIHTEQCRQLLGPRWLQRSHQCKPSFLQLLKRSGAGLPQ